MLNIQNTLELTEHIDNLVDTYVRKFKDVQIDSQMNFGEWVIKTYYPEVLESGLIDTNDGIKAIYHSGEENYVRDWLKIVFRRGTLQIKPI